LLVLGIAGGCLAWLISVWAGICATILLLAAAYALLRKRR
jgi:4-hydroxybenzoate polyprenyltransferase